METLAQQAEAALRTVYDPEAGLNLVDLGLIYRIEATDDGAVSVTMTFTTEACPAGPFLVQAVENSLRALPVVTDVSIDVTFDPPWSLDRISYEGRETLRL
ncbi:MAG: metal-sulfur cluster assembly factor [Bauldia litoralis]